MARIAILTSPGAPKPTLRRDLALAGVLVVFVATLAIGITALRTSSRTAHIGPSARPSRAAVATASPAPQVAAADLARSGVSSDLVTPFGIQATDQGRTATLVGGYADPVEMVLVFHLDGTEIEETTVTVTDEPLSLRASTSSFRSKASGFSVLHLDGIPYPGSGGVAHLTVELTSWKLGGGPGPGQPHWTFSIALPVHAATTLPAPAPFQLGRWKVTTEVLEVTPILVYFQALINGASIPEIGLSTIVLVDPDGKVIGQGCGASITVPKTQIDSPNSPLYHNARVYCQFAHPAAGGTYLLRFVGGGGRYILPISIKGVAGRESVQ